MTDQDLPQERAPLSAFEYWQQSVQAWADFSERTSRIMMSQIGGHDTGNRPSLDPDAETLASELLRTLSDLNLRHWQNTARFLEGLPSWMQMPHSMAGSALVDWFDNFQRPISASKTDRAAADGDDGVIAPDRLNAPIGDADDLTRIKGIGPKLSARLNELGIYHFKQIANWSEEQSEWVDEYLAFKGRVTREKWVNQARALSANGSATLH
ncbi:MAG: hypothetical protein AAF767_07105 [Pseudomonadota bacterium]